MEADEALARQLQAEEEAAAAAPSPASGGRQRIASLLADAARKVQFYEDELAQAMALSVMPMEQLGAAADEAVAVSVAFGEAPPLASEDALAQELLAWFKGSFFSWVNAPPCSSCSAAATAAAGMGAPTPEEAAHGAGRVELYMCRACGAATRFPRYNDPAKLLETRRGRCGEWANCFTLCCRAAGLDARLAVDLEDHVWTEHWSCAQQKWVHLDPCEAACDKPLLYEAGWGKKLSYVLAVGRHGAADVTRRYTQQWADVCQRRRLVDEAWLQAALREATARLRAGHPPEERRRLEARDEADQQAMLRGAGLSAAQLAALPARTTGDAAWLAARGEDGRDGAAAAAGAAGAAAEPPGTRYRWAKDGGLAAAAPARVCGGAVRASGENAPGEAARHAFDGSLHTKWLDFGGAKAPAYLEYRLPAEAPPVRLASYALTSANDCPERDPRHVVLEAWLEDAGGWVTLDEQRSLRFPARHHRLELALAGGAAAAAPLSRRFRLRVLSVADAAAANSVQLCCVDLYRRQDNPQQAQQQQQQQQEQRAGAAGAVPPLPTQAQPSSPQLSAARGGGAPQAPQPEPANPWAGLFLGGS